MASIYFYPYKKTGASKVYVRIYVQKGVEFRLSTTLSIIDSAAWDDNKRLPKKNSDKNRVLRDRLLKLEQDLDDYFLNFEYSEDKNISLLNGRQLKIFIKKSLNNNDKSEDRSNYLVDYAESFTNGLVSYKVNGETRAYTQLTIDKYHNLVRHLRNYEKHTNTILFISESGNKLAEALEAYYKYTLSLSINTIAGYTRRLKTILKSAESDGKNPPLSYRSIKAGGDKKAVVFLSENEIQAIENKVMPTDELQLTKDWLLISVYTGQRVSDLFRMHKEMFIVREGVKYIDLVQFKTKTQVSIPVYYKLKPIFKKYKGDFPPKLRDTEKHFRTELSKQIKVVCRIAGITQEIEGRYNGVRGMYPKYKLIQTHTGRRSFCNNFYNKDNYNINMVMSASGHKSERSFLSYLDHTDKTLSTMMGKQFAADEANASKDVIKLREAN